MNFFDNLEINDLCNIQLTVYFLRFHIGSCSCNAVVVREKFVWLVVYGAPDTAVYAFGSTRTKESTDIPFEHLATVVDINIRKQLTRNNCNIGLVSKVFTDIALDAWDSNRVIIRLKVNHNRIIIE